MTAARPAVGEEEAKKGTPRPARPDPTASAAVAKPASATAAVATPGRRPAGLAASRDLAGVVGLEEFPRWRMVDLVCACVCLRRGARPTLESERRERKRE